MTWLACSLVGTSSPRAAAARRMQSAIVLAESMMVPSQSKTSSGYFKALRVFSWKDRFRDAKHILRQWRTQAHAFPRQRMRKRELGRVQHKPGNSLLCQRLVQIEIAVLVVAQHRMPGVGEVHANLVGAAGEKTHFELADIPAPLGDLHLGNRAHTAFAHADAALAGAAYIFVQRL